MTIVLDVDYQFTFKQFLAQQSAEFYWMEDNVSFILVIIFSDRTIRTVVMKQLDIEAKKKGIFKIDEGKAQAFRLHELHVPTGTRVIDMHNIPKPVHTGKYERMEDLPEGTKQILENAQPVEFGKKDGIVKPEDDSKTINKIMKEAEVKRQKEIAEIKKTLGGG